MTNLTENNYINDLNTNQLSDYTFYKSTHHTLFRDNNLLVWIGIMKGQKIFLMK